MLIPLLCAAGVFVFGIVGFLFLESREETEK